MTLAGSLDQVDFYSGINYQKKFLTGTFTTTLNAGNAWESTQVILHNLGYRPNAKVWIEQDGDDHIRTPNPINSPKETVVITRIYTDRIEVTCSSPTLINNVALNVYYEIYLDADDTGETLVTFDTKYPIDRVYQVLEGSFSVGSGATVTTSATHTQAKPMIFKAIWSIDNVNWYSVRDFYDSTDPSINFAGEFDVDATKVNIYAANNFGTTKTFYYKIALIEPELDYPTGFTTSGINFDTRKDTFKNFQSVETSQLLSGTIATNTVKTFEVTLTNSQGLNVSDFYFKTSADAFYYNGYIGAGTGLIYIPITGGDFDTELPLELFLQVKSGETKAILYLFNTDINTVTITNTTIDLRFILYISPF